MNHLIITFRGIFFSFSAKLCFIFSLKVVHVWSKISYYLMFHQTWPDTLLGDSLSWGGGVTLQGSYTDVKQLFQDLDLVQRLQFFPFFTHLSRICTTCLLIISVAHCGCARIQILLYSVVHELFLYNLGDVEHISKDVSYRGWGAISAISSSDVHRVPTISFCVAFFSLKLGFYSVQLINTVPPWPCTHPLHGWVQGVKVFVSFFFSLDEFCATPLRLPLLTYLTELINVNTLGWL